MKDLPDSQPTEDEVLGLMRWVAITSARYLSGRREQGFTARDASDGQLADEQQRADARVMDAMVTLAQVCEEEAVVARHGGSVVTRRDLTLFPARKRIAALLHEQLWADSDLDGCLSLLVATFMKVGWRLDEPDRKKLRSSLERHGFHELHRVRYAPEEAAKVLVQSVLERSPNTQDAIQRVIREAFPEREPVDIEIDELRLHFDSMRGRQPTASEMLEVFALALGVEPVQGHLHSSLTVRSGWQPGLERLLTDAEEEVA
jgi:hypothetical protein